jgi:hypothetical protein
MTNKTMHKQLAATIVATIAVTTFAGALRGEKKLIEFGWDQPTTRFLRGHVGEMEKSPFDGCVFGMMVKNADGSEVKFKNECWGHRKFTAAELQPALDDLQAVHFEKFKDSFLRVNVTPGNVDWFDDFSAITGNAQLAARVAHDGGVKGILLDVEPYAAPLFDYQKMRDAKIKSFDAYAAQTRKRGRQIMDAFQKGYPDLTVFLTFGFTMPQTQMDAQSVDLAHVSYGLLPALLNGMLDAARGNSQIIDGYEISYAYKKKSQFDAAMKVRQRSLALVANRQQYARHYRFAFGLWMDNDSDKIGWHNADVEKNFFTPELFERSLRMALQSSDQYVWIYTQVPKWWSAKGQQNLPHEYEAALEQALAH